MCSCDNAEVLTGTDSQHVLLGHTKERVKSQWEAGGVSPEWPADAGRKVSFSRNGLTFSNAHFFTVLVDRLLVGTWMSKTLAPTNFAHQKEALDLLGWHWWTAIQQKFERKRLNVQAWFDVLC